MMLDHRLVCIAGLSVLLLPASAAFADGKIFAGTVTSTTPVIIPDQQVMIAYQDGMQTMVIRNRFTGAGSEFAWIVPVPSLPTVTQTSNGLFPTLESICAPRLVHSVPNLAPWLLVACGVGVFLIYRKITHALALTLLFVIWTILLPSLYTGHHFALSPRSVTIHSYQQIGNHEVTTISSDDPKALTTWLKDRQFAIDAKSESIIADYAAAKWFFCAIKMRREEKEGTSAAPPLAFRFAAANPVYPLRLTGTHEGGCNVDLYIFGPGRAQLNLRGLETILCRPVDYPDDQADPRVHRRPNTRVPVVHPRLSELVQGDVVLTRLAGRLSPASMSRDASISWTPFEQIQSSVHSSAAVLQMVTNISTGIWGLAALALAWAARRKRLAATSAIGGAAMLGCLLSAVGLGAYHLWPKVEVHMSHLPKAYNQHAHETIAALAATMNDVIRGTPAKKLAIARQNVAKAIELNSRDQTIPLNNFTGQPRREEDSPGNYGFRVTEHGVEYLWYDEEGREHSITIQGRVIPAWSRKKGIESAPVCSQPVEPSSMAAPTSRIGE